jgi:hypothetical protein
MSLNREEALAFKCIVHGCTPEKGVIDLIRCLAS